MIFSALENLSSKDIHSFKGDEKVQYINKLNYELKKNDINSRHIVAFPSLSRIKPKASASVQTAAAQQLVTRVIKDRAAEFVVSVNPDITAGETDAFTVSIHVYHKL